MDFGDVEVNQSPQRSVTVQGVNLDDPITYSISGDSEFTYTVNGTRAITQDDTLQITFAPTAVGDYSAIITCTSGSIVETINLTGKCIPPPSITITPTSYDFGDGAVGEESATVNFTVVGESLTSIIGISTLTNFTITKASGWDNYTGGTLEIAFKPQTLGSISEILVAASGAYSDTTTLTGNGLYPGLSVAPTSFTFPDTVITETSTTTVVVTGSDLLADITINVDDGFQYSFGSNWDSRTGGNLIVEFTPTEAVNYYGDITITSGNVSIAVSLTGTG